MLVIPEIPEEITKEWDPSNFPQILYATYLSGAGHLGLGGRGKRKAYAFGVAIAWAKIATPMKHRST